MKLLVIYSAHTQEHASLHLRMPREVAAELFAWRRSKLARSQQRPDAFRSNFNFSVFIFVPPFFLLFERSPFSVCVLFFLPLFSVCHSKRCETELGRAVSERPHALWSSVRIGLNRMNIGKLKSRAILSLGSSLRCFSLKKQDLFT